MVRVLVLLAHIRHTTYAFELARRLHERSDTEVTVVSYEDRSVEEIEVPLDGSLQIVPLGARFRFDPQAITRLHALLSNGKFDLLHTHHNFVGSLGRALAPRDLAIVNTEHGNHRNHYSTLQNIVNTATLWRADRVVANSEATRRSFYPIERRLLTADQIDVIHNGIDTQRIDDVLSQSEQSFTTSRQRIVTVGRMIPTKNFPVLLHAFAAIVDHYPDVRLTFVGDGPQQPQLKSLATDYGIADRVEFTGVLPRDDVYRILDASDIFALPSLSEGFCVAAVEAMACETPVVISDIDVLHEVAGPTGRYADPRDPESFADHLSSFLDDTEARTNAADDANERARTRFSLEHAADEYDRLYADVLD